jgi:hypothetical protein
LPAAVLFSLLLVWHWPIVPPLTPHGLGYFPDKATTEIVILQDEQRMLLLQGGEFFRAFPISTGAPAARETTTPAWQGPIGKYWGTFSSFGTTQDHGYWLFTDYLPGGRWNGDILIHGAPYTIGLDGEKQYRTEHIGKIPASHGCIQLLPADAEWFRAWDPIGVRVTIEPITRAAGISPRRALAAQSVAASQRGIAALPPVGR